MKQKRFFLWSYVPLPFEIYEAKVQFSLHGPMVHLHCSMLLSDETRLMVKCLQQIDISCFDKPCFMSARVLLS
jgi:hypothetical protein